MSEPEASASRNGRGVERLVRAEINGRRVNEAIERGQSPRAEGVFVCECGELGCNTTLTLSRAEYDAVRTDFDRFVVVPGHEQPAVDRVVERHAGYVVVCKQPGKGREMARATDPRTGASDDPG